MKDTTILVRRAVFGGYTAVWSGKPQLPIEAYMATGKGHTREEAVKDLFTLVPQDVIRRELMPFTITHSEDYHPV